MLDRLKSFSNQIDRKIDGVLGLRNPDGTYNRGSVYRLVVTGFIGLSVFCCDPSDGSRGFCPEGYRIVTLTNTTKGCEKSN